MTTKILTGHYASGYSLNGVKYSGLELTKTATVGGGGVYAVQASILNFGAITATTAGHAGVYLSFGGSVNNGDFFDYGKITGTYGVFIGYQGPGASELGTVTNYGYIGATKMGVVVDGRVTNSGSIHGGANGVYTFNSASTVTNYGTISGGAGDGVLLGAGGKVVNGTASDPRGFIGGKYGVIAQDGGSVANIGAIEGVTMGVLLRYGAALTNGSAAYHAALIEGNSGVEATAATHIFNFGTILGGSAANEYGVVFQGLIANGAATDTTARIQGATGVYAAGVDTVINYGTVVGSRAAGGAYGVVMDGGGVLTNGPGALVGALIEGNGGVRSNYGQIYIANFGTIEATAQQGAYGINVYSGTVKNGLDGGPRAHILGPGGVRFAEAGTLINNGYIGATNGAGALFFDGGTLVNGSATDFDATLFGSTRGVFSLQAATNVTNFGTLEGTNQFSVGVYEYDAGATVTNGSAQDHGAFIAGSVGVEFERGATLINSGFVEGRGAAGVIANGGLVDNKVKTALIQGSFFGIEALDGAETVKNFGTVNAYGLSGSYGVSLDDGGRLANGSAKKGTATVKGYGGARLLGGASATNLGTIVGIGDNGGSGVFLGLGGALTNGAVRESGGIVEGYTGVTVAAGAAATVTNFGAIQGFGGTAVQFGSAADVLVVEGGSSFTGAVNGDGGTIVLANATGALTLLAGDGLTVSGSMAPTTFSAFATVEVGAGGVFTLAAGGTIAGGQTLASKAKLTVAGALTNGGTLEAIGGLLTVNGAVAGAGQAEIAGGTLYLRQAFSQNVVFNGKAGELELGKSQGYAAAISGFSKTGATSLDLRDIAFTGAGEATFSGTATSGLLTVTDGTHTATITLIGDYLGSSFLAASDSHGGVTITASTPGSAPPGAPAGVPPNASPESAPRRFIDAMAGLAGGAGAASLAGPIEAAREPMLAAPQVMTA